MEIPYGARSREQILLMRGAGWGLPRALCCHIGSEGGGLDPKLESARPLECPLGLCLDGHSGF